MPEPATGIGDEDSLWHGCVVHSAIVSRWQDSVDGCRDVGECKGRHPTGASLARRCQWRAKLPAFERRTILRICDDCGRCQVGRVGQSIT